MAVDIGCGTGQSTRPLAPYFENVLGFDISEAQVENAKKEDTPENVEYRYVHLIIRSVPLTTGKNEKVHSSHVPAIKIYIVEAVGLKRSNYTKKKNTIFVIM